MLFPTRIVGGGAGDAGLGRQYDVTRDGRFLINTVLADGAATPITLIMNWRPGSQEIERLLRQWLLDRPGAAAGDCAGQTIESRAGRA